MGRPKEFEYDIVIQAATECFWDNGIRGTSISALVSSMKIQRSSFYNSFGSRDEMYQLVLDTYLSTSPLKQFASRDAADSSDAPDLLLLDFMLDYCGFLVHPSNGRGCLFFNGLSELSKEDDKAFECLQDSYLRLTDQLSDLFGRIADNSRLPKPLDRLDLNQLMMVLMGLNDYSKHVQDKDLLIKVALDQLSALSPHFAELIKSHQRDDLAQPEVLRLKA